MTLMTIMTLFLSVLIVMSEGGQKDAYSQKLRVGA